MNDYFWRKLDGAKICSFSTEKNIRRTKIVCTIGPNTQTVEALEALIRAGMNVVRMNFSHGDHDFHLKTIENARKAMENTNTLVGIMLDTKGPEIRTGVWKDNSVKEYTLKKGQEYLFSTDPKDYALGDDKKVFIDYVNIVNVIKPKDRILVDDGLISCLVTEVGPNYVKTIVENSGKIGTKKGCNLPQSKVDLPALTEKDIGDLEFGVKNGIDFVAASFTRKADDVIAIRKVLGGKDSKIKIICKIENLEGMTNFDSILSEADGIMVARGDLGVEIPLERVVLAQKMMIAKCNLVGKPVITATQMLETMIYNPRPTRAEATDVANAVFDGTDCVMLSGETAKGDYPVQAVERMANICLTTEEVIDYPALYNSLRNAVLKTSKKLSTSETIASSAVKTALELDAKLIISLTETGNTARLVSKYSPHALHVVITQHKQTARQLNATKSCISKVVDSILASDNIVKKVVKEYVTEGRLHSGDAVVIVFGNVEGVQGQTNNLKVIIVD